MQHILNN